MLGGGVSRRYHHRPNHHDRPERAELLPPHGQLVRRRAGRQPAGLGQGRLQQDNVATKDQVGAAIQGLFDTNKKVTEDDVIGLLAKSILGG